MSDTDTNVTLHPQSDMEGDITLIAADGICIKTMKYHLQSDSPVFAHMFKTASEESHLECPDITSDALLMVHAAMNQSLIIPISAKDSHNVCPAIDFCLKYEMNLPATQIPRAFLPNVGENLLFECFVRCGQLNDRLLAVNYLLTGQRVYNLISDGLWVNEHTALHFGKGGIKISEVYRLPVDCAVALSKAEMKTRKTSLMEYTDRFWRLMRSNFEAEFYD